MHAFGKVAVTQAKFDVLTGNDEANPKVGSGRLQESCISFGLWDQLPPTESEDGSWWSHLC